MLDRCIRWRAAQVAPNKEDETLMKAINALWISTHGPPKELITDNESGIVISDKARECFARKERKVLAACEGSTRQAC